MNFRIPAWLVVLSDAFVDFVNVPIYRGVRRIDVLIAVLLVVCVLYYYFTAGWLTALAGGLMFIMFVMIGLWIL